MGQDVSQNKETELPSYVSHKIDWPSWEKRNARLLYVSKHTTISTGM